MRVVGGRAGGRRHRPKGGAADTLTRACCGVRAFEVRCHEAKGQTFQRAWTEARDVLSWVRFASSFDNMIICLNQPNGLLSMAEESDLASLA